MIKKLIKRWCGEGKKNWCEKKWPKRRPKGGHGGPKRGTIVIDPAAKCLIQSAAHIPPRAQWWRRLRGTTCGDHVVKRRRICEHRAATVVKTWFFKFRGFKKLENWRSKGLWRPSGALVDTKIGSESPGTRFLMIFGPFWGSPGGPFSSKIRPSLKKTFKNHMSCFFCLECLPRIAISASRAEFLPVLAPKMNKNWYCFWSVRKKADMRKSCCHCRKNMISVVPRVQKSTEID